MRLGESDESQESESKIPRLPETKASEGELQEGTSKEMVTKWKLSLGVPTIMTFLL